MQTARAHGSHFQTGSLSPRKPIIHRSGANLQVPRRTSLDCRNFVVYPSADRPDSVRTTGGPPHPLRGPSPRNSVDASRASPPTELLDQRYGCRAGQLMPYAASLAIYAVTDAGRGRSTLSAGRFLHQGSMASTQKHGA